MLELYNIISIYKLEYQKKEIIHSTRLYIK